MLKAEILLVVLSLKACGKIYKKTIYNNFKLLYNNNVKSSNSILSPGKLRRGERNIQEPVRLTCERRPGRCLRLRSETIRQSSWANTERQLVLINSCCY